MDFTSTFSLCEDMIIEDDAEEVAEDADGVLDSQEGPVVQSLKPSQGSISGNHLVTVHGWGLSSGTKPLCRFGGSAGVQATVIDYHRVLCHRPSLQSTGLHVLELSSDGGATYYSSAVPVLFEVLADLHISKVRPSSGPALGGTTLHIAGAGLDASDLQCVFGSANRPTTSKAQTLSSTAIACITTARQVAWEGTTVDLTVHGEGMRASSEVVRYTYYQPEIVHAVVPSHGPVKGGLPVTIFGEGFIDSSSLQCSFGDASASHVLWLAQTLLYVFLRAPLILDK